MSLFLMLRSIDKESKFYLFYLPIINSVLMSSTNLLKESIPLGLYRAIFSFLIIVIFFTRHHIKGSVLNLLYLFSIYYVLLGIVTFFKYSEFNVVALKPLIASSYFFFTYYFVHDRNSFNVLLLGLFSSLVIILLFLLTQTLLGVEARQVYVDIGINFGANGVNTTKVIAMLILPFPLYFSVLKKNVLGKYLSLIVLFSSIILVVLGFKRGAMLGSVLALLAMLYYSNYKLKYTRQIFTVIIVVLLASPIYFSKLVTVFEKRESQIELSDSNFDQEARIHEGESVINELTNPRRFVASIFGNGVGSEFFYFRTTRMFHTDIFGLLFKVGILGFLFYYLFYIRSYRILKKYYYSYFNSYFNNEISVGISMIVLAIILGISGFHHGIDDRGYFLFALGGILGYLKNSSMAKLKNNK